MSEKFLGCHLSIELKTNKANLQGKLFSISADNLSFQLKNVVENGRRSEHSTITVCASDVANLEIIRGPSPAKETKTDNDLLLTPIKDAPRFQRNGYDGRNKAEPGSSAPATPLRNWKRNNDSAFDIHVSEITEFDFEANLALFDKQAFKEEQLHPTEYQTPRKKKINFKHDENVIVNPAPVYQEIILPELTQKEFTTDSGLIVPSMSSSLRHELEQKLDEVGLTQEKRTELTARAVTELSVQLVGSHYRFDPKNRHQLPKAVVLCGNHGGSAGVICSARHLAAQGFRTTLLLPGNISVSQCLTTELKLLILAGGKIARQVEGLFCEDPDLIVCCLENASNNPVRIDHFVESASEWANKQRAPKLVIDPPVRKEAIIDAKATLVPYLPLSHGGELGNLYLINLCIPEEIFKSVGIRYFSPFGARFLIPLHPR
ncbi:enhancer of mRNA-decapping protein 3-like [Artemia franciscana]|uniref:enhancer of mRNA-decapping protein 3-like n=1 Tax=Artemia franciscana TaxID=6661 RepID=UPI0032D9E919